MIIDRELNVRVMPVSQKLNKLTWNEFKVHAEKLIDDFYNEISMICENKSGCSILIEHRIVGSASPAGLYNTQLHKPSDRTEFVRDLFHNRYERINKKFSSVKMAKQLRSDLKKTILKDFKKCLIHCEIIDKQRGNGYLSHLWALALHTTKTSLQQKTKELYNKFAMQEPKMMKEVTLRDAK